MNLAPYFLAFSLFFERSTAKISKNVQATNLVSFCLSVRNLLTKVYFCGILSKDNYAKRGLNEKWMKIKRFPRNIRI